MSSKILAPGGERKVTLQSLQWLLGGLACKVQIVSDDEALAQINGRLKQRWNYMARGGAVTIIRSRRFSSKIGRKGALARNAQRNRRKEARMQDGEKPAATFSSSPAFLALATGGECALDRHQQVVKSAKD
jgi:hypothetical protein